jgi:hypothetical protein
MPKISQKSKDTQTYWEDKINRAITVRQNWKDLFRVDPAKEYLDGKQRPPGYNPEEWITINNFYAHLKAKLPALYSADPYFYVKLKRTFNPHPMLVAAYEQKGKIRQNMLNYMKGRNKIKKKARLAIQDAQWSYGVLKSFYWAELVENPDKGNPMLSADGLPLLNDDGDEIIEPDQIPINGDYRTSRVHPDDFLWDEDAGPLEDDWEWVAQRIREPFEKVKNNPLFKNRAIDTITNDSGDTEEARKREERKKGSDVKGKAEREKSTVAQEQPKIIERWEIYLLKQKKWLVIAIGADEPLIPVSPLPKGVIDHPFSILRFTTRDDSPYPIPPMSQGIDPSREYNMARSDILKHRKRFNRKYAASRQAFGDDTNQVSKLERGDDGTILLCNGDVRGAVAPIQDAPLDQMRYAELNYLKADMIELFGGAHDEARGIAGADSATQAGILDKRLEMKEGDDMSMVMEFIVDWAERMDNLIQANIDRDTAVRINGPQGDQWHLVRAADYEEIEGEYEYSVNVGSTMPRMPQMERSSWNAFLGLLSNFPHLLMSKRLMKQMAENHHIEDEAMLEELFQIGQRIMGGQYPAPGNMGSQPGVGEDRPQSATGGMQQA